eukprot:550883-Prorocentrum_minimum.AAC.1
MLLSRVVMIIYWRIVGDLILHQAPESTDQRSLRRHPFDSRHLSTVDNIRPFSAPYFEYSPEHSAHVPYQPVGNSRLHGCPTINSGDAYTMMPKPASQCALSDKGHVTIIWFAEVDTPASINQEPT